MSLIAAAPLASAAEQDVQWGEPVAGLRVGISPARLDVESDHQPRFNVVLNNVSEQRLTLPVRTSYVRKPHEWRKEYFQWTLRPVIETVEGKKQTYSMSGSGQRLADARAAPAETMVLEPGASQEYRDLRLADCFYAPGEDGYMGETTRMTWVLLPDSTYRIRFTLENPQPAAPGQWKGTASSGAAVVRVTRPPVRATLAATFTVPKREYFLGEPIYVTFTVINIDSAPLRFPVGSDYRGTGRHERFSFVATSGPREFEKRVPDPVVPSGMGGGLGSTWTVEPGETYSETLLVNEWCAFNQEGEFTITCKRTLNLGDGIGLREETLPELKVERRLNVLIRRDDASLASYLEFLVARLEGGRGGDAATEFKALAMAQNEVAFPVIQRLARTKNASQSDAVQWLRHYGRARAAAPFLEAAKTAMPEVRREALRTLAEWQVPEADELIRQALASKDVQERRSAVELCYRRPRPQCLPELLRLADDRDDIVRRYLGAALGTSGDERAVPALRKLLTDPADVYINTWAAAGLHKLGKNDGVPALIELLRSGKADGEIPNVVSTLSDLTGEKFRDRQDWINWWDREGRGKFKLKRERQGP